MKITLTTLTLIFGLLTFSNGQTNSDKPSTTPIWTEADRKYLLDNLIRTKQQLIDETKNLTKKQWNFKESSDQWSINQIVEHIDRYELIFMHEISVAFQMGPIPDFPQHLPDSMFVDQDPKDLKKNKTTEFTKPFTISVPLGNNEGANNMVWFNKMRDESIDYVKNTTQNIRTHYINYGPDMHQKFMMIFTHTDRHIRQIKRVKANPNYPK
ncbi:MAG TPA: DinB family protein [Cyclobacteriaceae bacterium]|nr:DinB family protein [Cyclobacteriaceae bacterium]